MHRFTCENEFVDEKVDDRSEDHVRYTSLSLPTQNTTFRLYSLCAFTFSTTVGQRTLASA